MDSTTKQYIPVPINEFVRGVVIQVDLYIRLNEDKFVLVGRGGQHSNVDQFRAYADKEVHYLWVTKAEYPKLSNQSLALAGIALEKLDLDDKQKTKIVVTAARSTFRQIDHMGFDVATYNNAKQITQAVITVAESNKSLADLFNSLTNFDDQILTHSVAVSTVSVMLGHAMAYQQRSTLEKLSLGGLLHDIGLKALPRELIHKPLVEMTHEELALYETHPAKGMQMLQSIGIVPDDVVSIVYEHHENSLGQGYPQRIRDLKIHPLAKIVGVANAYVELIFQGPNNPVPRSPQEAAEHMEKVLGAPYNREVFRALKKLAQAVKKAA